MSSFISNKKAKTKQINLPVNLPKTAIIGANGFLGSYFFAAYRNKHRDCVGTAEDKRGGQLLYFDLFSPDISMLELNKKRHRDVLILAAIPGIDRCETDKELTRRVNVKGTLELIRQLAAEGLKPIYFSSDYVFDGVSGNYNDEAKPHPLMEYGRQKALIEEKIKELTNGNYLVVRLAKVFSLTKGDGTLLDEMASGLVLGQTIQAAYDQFFCPTLVSDVVKAVACLQAQEATGIINVCSPEIWSRYDLASSLAKTMKIPADRVHKVLLAEIDFRVKRPKNTSLIAKRLLLDCRLNFVPISKCLEAVARNWIGRGQ
jgi:dTDP-4-dehydrorhamnose reductase